MFGITINDKHTWRDHGLGCLQIELSTPEAVTSSISVPGMDGEYDITEAVYGRVTYKIRQFKGEFEGPERSKMEHMAKSALLDKLYAGRKARITLDSDPDHYLMGRLSLEHSHENIYGSHIITAECEPYRYKTALTRKSYNVSESLETTLTNTQMPVCPVFTTEAGGMEVEFDGKRYSVIPGGVQIPEINLSEGENLLKLYGAGLITVEYREGEL